MLASPNPPPGKRLAVLFDGTWNTPESKTNVWELRQLLADNGADGVPQLAFYDEGVGTHWFDRLSGGAFGFGLSENVRQGYRWLMQHYRPGDEIFLFGFSRGAFTARSLAGFMSRCGLLKSEDRISVDQAFARYRQGDAVRPIYKLLFLQRNAQTNFTPEEQALLQSSFYHRDLIKMVGVWDTVGSIGVPFGNLPGVSSRTLHFHNTHLSRIVQHSYQALALDEQRKPFWAILWTNYTLNTPSADDPPQTDDRFIEQRWFAGAHSDVGGGYENDPLPRRPRAWMQDKAAACGLAFKNPTPVTDDDLTQKPHDSYAEGAWKWFSFFKLFQRYTRWVMADPIKKPEHQKYGQTIPAGVVQTVNERLDLSVFRRCQLDPGYRPASLLEWAPRKKLDLNAIIAKPESFPQFSSPVTKPGIEP